MQTLIARETFQAVGTLNGGTPGNLGAVTGSFYKRAKGPRVLGDTTANSLGWSADFQNNSPLGVIDPSGGAANAIGMVSAWYYAVSGAPAIPQHKMALIALRHTNQNALAEICVLSNGNIGHFANFGPDANNIVDSGVAFPYGVWTEFRAAWNLTAFNTWDIDLFYRASGSATWTTLHTYTGQHGNAGNDLAWLGWGQTADSGRIRGRFGMPSLYALGAWSDRTTLISDVVDPTGGTTWYVNPLTGSDTNDGVSATSAWQTAAKIHAESAYCGMFPVSTGYANGDTLVIAASGDNYLDFGTTAVTINTRGLNITSVGAGTYARLKYWAVPVGWTLSAGTSHVYETTDSSATDLAGVVVWEDDKWLNHPTGADFAAVSAMMDATPGSFFSDGTKLYLHPFGSTNPTSDGKTYTRSRNRNGDGTSALTIAAPDVHLSWIHARKTALARSTDNDPIQGYCVQFGTGTLGTTLIENSYFDYSAKHALGFTFGGADSHITVRDVQCEQGTPYADQNPFVVYVGSGAANHEIYFIRAKCLKVKGLIGSTVGATSATTQVYYTHNDGGSDLQFAVQSFTDCDWSGGAVSSGISALDQWIGTRATSARFTATTTVDRCRFDQMNGDSANTNVTARNSIIGGAVNLSAGGNAQYIQGTWDIQGCTIDLRSATSGDSIGGSLFVRNGPLVFTFRNNAVLEAPTIPYDGGGTAGTAILRGATSADTIIIDHMKIVLGTSALLLKNYNDGSTIADRTFAEAVTLGLVTNSSSETDLTLGADYRPRAGSPVIDAGVDLGPLADYTGTVFDVRDDIGAFEYRASSRHIKQGGQLVNVTARWGKVGGVLVSL